MRTHSDQLRRFALIILGLSLMGESPCFGQITCSRVYSSDSDFCQGQMVNTIITGSGQLQMNTTSTPMPFITVACSDRGSIARINTTTGAIIGEYWSSPAGSGRNPSRTTVDLYGNVWVGNRAEMSTIGGVVHGSIVKIGVVIGGVRGNKGPGNTFVPDINGEYLQPPFEYSTVVDRDGDGLIRTSNGLGNILAWGAGDRDGGVAHADDECILVYTRLPNAPATRHVSVDANNDVWVAGYNNAPSWFHKLDGMTGAIQQSFNAASHGTGGYGGLIDGDGILWSVGPHQHSILRYDPVSNTGTTIEVQQTYGLAIDSRGYIWNSSNPASKGHVTKIDPTGVIQPGFPVLTGGVTSKGVAVTPDDHIWIANSSSNTVSRLDNSGAQVAIIAVGSEPTGLAVDADGKVWVTNYKSHDVMRIDPATNTVDLTVGLNAGAGPYNYSDMTGIVAIGSTAPLGFWTTIHDGGENDVEWGSLAWTGDTPPGTGIKVEARASNVIGEFPGISYTEVKNGFPLCQNAITGRYVEIRVTLSRTAPGSTPTLNDLTISCCRERIIHWRPQLLLSANEVLAGETMIIYGRNYSPYGTVNLEFFGPSYHNSATVQASHLGKFEYPFTAPLDLSDGPPAHIFTHGIDNTTSKESGAVVILVNERSTNPSLEILLPSENSTYYTNDEIEILWADVMHPSVLGVRYPMESGTANRLYSYRVEYQIDGSSPWLHLADVHGKSTLRDEIVETAVVRIGKRSQSARIRVMDSFNSGVVAMSSEISIADEPTELKITKHWDHSSQEWHPATVRGVAADGVARILLKVENVDKNGPKLKSVSINLGGHANGTAQLLGKIMPAEETRAYSEEANIASKTSIKQTGLDSDVAWFWYVAPDDFEDDPLGYYSTKKKRTVTASIVAEFQGGKDVPGSIDIEIVRPPVMFVHGLWGDRNTFSKLNYTDGDSTIRFMEESERNIFWPSIRVPEMFPGASFHKNAEQLLYAPGKRSMQSTISKLRSIGYASNQVDYICHSMGGSILRTAIADFPVTYRASYDGTWLKNYGKGFVHKAITINTPHNGSPWANIFYPSVSSWSKKLISKAEDLNRFYWFRPHLYQSWLEAKLNKDGTVEFFSADAIRDLRVNDGVLHRSTPVRHHLFAGDIDLGVGSIIFTNPMLFVVKLLMQGYRWSIDPDGYADEEDAKEASQWYVELLKREGYGEVLFAGDGVVTVSSQLAGHQNQTTANRTVFRNTALMNAFHTMITGRTDVGDEIKSLLNSPVSGGKFEDRIPANPNVNSFSRTKTTERAVNGRVPVEYYDTSKVKIDSPGRGESITVDSMFVVSFRIKDTTNLMYVEYFASEHHGTIREPAPSYKLFLPAQPDGLGRQVVAVGALYRSGSGYSYHIDTVSIIVESDQILERFSVFPDVVQLQIGETYLPEEYLARYKAFNSAVSMISPEIEVEVGDPSIIEHDARTGSFTAKSASSTIAVIGFRGLRDTLYIDVIEAPNFAEGGVLVTPGKVMSGITLHPNPSTENISIFVEDGAPPGGTVSIYTVLGQRIGSYPVAWRRAAQSGNEGYMSSSLNVRDLQPGAYWVNVTASGSSRTTQLIKY